MSTRWDLDHKSNAGFKEELSANCFLSGTEGRGESWKRIAEREGECPFDNVDYGQPLMSL